MGSPDALRRSEHRDAHPDHAVTLDNISARVCVACGRVLGGGSMSRKRYCSATCRQRACRERREERAVAKYEGLLRGREGR